jgi:hypothetical protein
MKCKLFLLTLISGCILTGSGPMFANPPVSLQYHKYEDPSRFPGQISGTIIWPINAGLEIPGYGPVVPIGGVKPFTIVAKTGRRTGSHAPSIMIYDTPVQSAVATFGRRTTSRDGKNYEMLYQLSGLPLASLQLSISSQPGFRVREVRQLSETQTTVSEVKIIHP